MKFKKCSIILFFVLTHITGFAQQDKSENSSTLSYQKKYVINHEVVKGKAKKFLRFYKPNDTYKVTGAFEKFTDTSTFVMKTSGKTIPQKYFIRYGRLTFTIHDTILHLTVFQSKAVTVNPQYKDYLFIPFTDKTTGDETYGSGRYIDILISDIRNNTVELDFNKAYNPYCAYTTGYNCPIPPKENFLPIAIQAGEKTFAKSLVQ